MKSGLWLVSVQVQTDEPLPNTEDAMTSLPTETAPPTPQPLLRVNEAQIRTHLDEMVRTTVEKTLNDLLDAEGQCPSSCATILTLS